MRHSFTKEMAYVMQQDKNRKLGVQAKASMLEAMRKAGLCGELWTKPIVVSEDYCSF